MNRTKHDIPTVNSQAMWWVIYVDDDKAQRGVATVGYDEVEALDLAEQKLEDKGVSTKHMKAIRCNVDSEPDCKLFLSTVKEFFRGFDSDLESAKEGARKALNDVKILYMKLKKRGEFN